MSNEKQLCTCPGMRMAETGSDATDQHCAIHGYIAQRGKQQHQLCRDAAEKICDLLSIQNEVMPTQDGYVTRQEDLQKFIHSIVCEPHERYKREHFDCALTYATRIQELAASEERLQRERDSLAAKNGELEKLVEEAVAIIETATPSTAKFANNWLTRAKEVGKK